jgi:hypothetical protein
MTTTPFEPHEERDEEGRDAPRPAPGSEVEDKEPDEVPERAAGQGEPVEPPD